MVRTAEQPKGDIRPQYGSRLAASNAPKRKQRKTKKSLTSGSADVFIGRSREEGCTFNSAMHRIRDLRYVPAEIVSMSNIAMHNDGTSRTENYIAIARSDGSIELKSSSDKFWSVASVAGSRHLVPSVIEWVPADNADDVPTLVGGSADGSLFIVDFQSCQICARSSSGGGGVFSMARLHGCGGAVAVGCEDGAIRIITTPSGPDGKYIDCIKTLPSVGSAILSLAWKSKRLVSSRNGYDAYETSLHCGVANGTIHQTLIQMRFAKSVKAVPASVESVQSSFRMTAESKGRVNSTKIWCMEQLDEATLVIGTSLGKVQFFDTTRGTMVQSIDHNALNADVLTLAVSPNRTSIFASGIDSRIVCIERQDDPNERDELSIPWRLTGAQRPHTHDVKSLVVCSSVTSDGEASDVLLSGGVDTKMCSFVIGKFSKLRPNTMFPWPTRSPIQGCSAHGRLLIMQRLDRVDVYEIKKGCTVEPSDTTTDRVGKVCIKSTSNLVASSISHDGQFLAVCDASNLYLFSMNASVDLNGRIERLSVKQIDGVETLKMPPLLSLKFMKDDAFVAADIFGRVHMCTISGRSSITHSVLLDPAKEKDGASEEARLNWPCLPKTSISISHDERYIATLSHRLRDSVVILKQQEVGGRKLFKYHWTLPSVGERVSAMTFIRDASKLAIATPFSKVYTFDLKQKRLTSWSEKNGYPLTNVPSELNNKSIIPIRMTSDPERPDMLLMGSFGMFCIIDLSTPFPNKCWVVPEKHVRRRKKGGCDGPAKVCTMCLRYNSMLFFDYVDAGEIVVVEQPWLDVVDHFPHPMERKIYGAT
eukprot:CAMPEP_0119552644 /NCGR_PEP_ID=MMETSP1352-20130426/5569_1 /TAXON_ID=265584 /ORGANISM="Stauroneis constricta, Strain CCMP1120" /LENGTH=817 /DNA_ID=CAMNT_0007598901 /DNA_START=61 /DNA_END=2514 /DNA_ORIENTATION=+